jgi:hypothetical protein
MESWIRQREKRIFLQVQKIVLEIDLSLKLNQKEQVKIMTMLERYKLEQEITQVQQKLLEVNKIINRDSLLSAAILRNVDHCNKYDQREAEDIVRDKVERFLTFNSM